MTTITGIEIKGGMKTVYTDGRFKDQKYMDEFSDKLSESVGNPVDFDGSHYLACIEIEEGIEVFHKLLINILFDNSNFNLLRLEGSINQELGREKNNLYITFEDAENYFLESALHGIKETLRTTANNIYRLQDGNSVKFTDDIERDIRDLIYRVSKLERANET